MEADIRQAPSRARRLLILAVKVVLLAAVLWYVGRALANAIGQVDWTGVRFRPTWILGGAALVFVSVCFAAAVCRGLYKGLGVKLGRRQSFSLFTAPMMGVYLPGRFLSIAGHAAIARSFGAPLAVGSVAVLIVLGLGVVAALLVGLAFMLAGPVETITWGILMSAIGATAVLTLIVLHPKLYVGILNRCLRLLKRPTISATLSRRTMAALLLGMCMFILLYAAGFVGMVLGVVDLPASTLPALAGSICIANTIGLLAIFAPGGIGVREGVLLVTLQPMLDAGTAALVIVLLRLLQVVADVALSGAGLILFRSLRKEAGDSG